MNEFTASNGIHVRNRPAGRVVTDGKTIPNTVIASAKHEQALREFFRAEGDARLGRWRWPDNPDYVVYLVDGDAVIFDEVRPWRGPDRIRRSYIEDPPGFLGWGEFAARAYFDAHPEPKPAWHEARHGEAWLLIIDGVERVAVRGPVEDFIHLKGVTPWSSPTITAGRRIWPEVAS